MTHHPNNNLFLQAPDFFPHPEAKTSGFYFGVRSAATALRNPPVRKNLN